MKIMLKLFKTCAYSAKSNSINRFANRHMRLLCLTLIVLVQGPLFAQNLTKVPAERVGFSSERLEFLTSTLQDYVDQEKLAGAVVLVARKGQIAYLETFGKRDIENNDPMPEDAIFRIASQTKAITSVGVMMLQEEGKLLISDPVGKYIHEFKETTVAVEKEDGSYEIVKAKRPITIRDLLTHTSGIGYGYGVAKDLWKEADIRAWYFADREEPILETVKRMAALPFDAQPGEKFVYGYSTDILGAVIEVVSGESLDAFLTTRILEPLGMNDTHFYLPESKSDRLATVYGLTKEGQLKKGEDPGGREGQGMYVDGPRKSFSGGAGLLSTAMDYAKFLQMMLNGGTYNGQRIISRKTVALMTANQLDFNPFPWTRGSGFGLGFSIVEDMGLRGELGSKGEFSWSGAYHSAYWADPEEDMLVVYLTQLIPARGLDDREKLRALIYQALVD